MVQTKHNVQLHEQKMKTRVVCHRAEEACLPKDLCVGRPRKGARAQGSNDHLSELASLEPISTAGFFEKCAPWSPAPPSL